MSLHTTDLGDRGSRVVFCHGLFGQGKNWTQVGKQLATDHRVTLVDMPHHGRSSWPEEFDYVDVADRVAQLLDADDPVTLVGHSMGGKAAMVLALRHPELVARLCVVDMSPVDYGGHAGEFRRYIDAMQGMDLDAITTRAEADAALVDAVPNNTVRSFLLQNLRRDGDGWRWQANLEVLGRDLAELGGWPEDDLAGTSPYEGPVLWVAGETSPYVSDEFAPAMERYFPRVRRVTVKGAGHWVHSEQPEIFLEVLRRFVAAEDRTRLSS
ncbi:alpha/beta fold hydrolase [Phycicoccus sp. SLBN-51]|jgi:pimeloyl-ACP methyl ester carboxylesterase|uniref:alpha/beta fold hydrolase n=1 Tax=Phycicoccus sp. SLBN-51 TaxID=2768447 RepID=UPI00114F4854|nr:alpha/beta fold hydrolase [Phycicoccus sp. SLBN-51]TQJ49945.1 pimeloyl-ACP methyl ester carboxylesterase [Phycicoccus sp. SLBN-51]